MKLASRDAETSFRNTRQSSYYILNELRRVSLLLYITPSGIKKKIPSFQGTAKNRDDEIRREMSVSVWWRSRRSVRGQDERQGRKQPSAARSPRELARRARVGQESCGCPRGHARQLRFWTRTRWNPSLFF